MRKVSPHSHHSEEKSKGTLWRLFTILVAVSASFILVVFGVFHYHIGYSTHSLSVASLLAANDTVVKSGKQKMTRTPVISPLSAYTVVNSSHRHLYSDFNDTFFLNWHFRSSMFQYLNYKSLESMLLTYPNATFEIRIVAPEPANYYKVGDVLSKTTFMKYTKQGFKIYTLIIDGINDRNKISTVPGDKYWQEVVNKCFSPLHITQMRRFPPPPHHLSMYDTVRALYHRGGVYTDFSYFHFHSILPKSGVGYMSKFSYDSDEKRIVASSIFVFLTYNHPILLCMLKLFDDPVFLSCLNKDTVSDGVFCVDHGMASCFQQTQTENMLSSFNSPNIIYINLIDVTADLKNTLNLSGVEYSQFQVVSLPLRIEDFVFSSQHSSTTLSQQNALLWLGHCAYSQGWIIPRHGKMLRELIEISNQRLSLEYQTRLSQRYTFQVANTTHHCSPYHTLQCQSPFAQARERLSCAMHFVIPGFMKAGTTYLYETIANHPLVVRNLRGVAFKETGCYDPPLLMPAGVNIQSFLESVASSRSRQNRDKSSYVVKANNYSLSPSSSMTDFKSENALLYRRRMDCFPFIESHDHVQYGDGTVFYAAQLGTPSLLMLDNPQIKVIFAVRRPVERLESHHRFDYRAFVAKGVGDINYCIDLILGDDDVPPQYIDKTSNKLVLIYHLAKQALEASDDVIKKAKLLQEIVTLFQSKIILPPKGTNNGKHFHRCAKLFFDSFYLPAILNWLKIVPRDNILVIDVEQLTASGKTTQQKEEALLQPPAVEMKDLSGLVGARKGMKITHEDRQQHEKLKTYKEKFLDRKFLLYQFNAIFKFLSLPQLKRFTVSGRHDSEHAVPTEHQMTEKTRQKLEEYFRPFMMLLIEVLNENSN